eukprot:TRINITY_DN14336_c0_g1_i2.p4 TRINITY_DN14336_c0_g1~~TRINITY_DN14336_c0_g1_i2.p4  ORF type:complete len:100 (-),score=14.42 TRINITY_DN14336_c0_g1_i2:83-382(-)
MIRRPPRSTQGVSSAASDVYKRQITDSLKENYDKELSRKQKEIATVNELLAQWILKYIELEKARGPINESALRALLIDISIHSSTALGLASNKTVDSSS